LPHYTFVQADWSSASAAISRVRRPVFIVEQGVTEYEEWDAADAQAVHVLCHHQKRDAVGTGRLERSGKVGRVAVLHTHRGRGVGAGILRELLTAARIFGVERAFLNAQVQAARFYEALGFSSVGAPFMEAGIAHIRMELPLEPDAHAEYQG
jgi:predicted GNAT family N-acyltransferase